MIRWLILFTWLLLVLGCQDESPIATIADHSSDFDDPPNVEVQSQESLSNRPESSTVDRPIRNAPAMRFLLEPLSFEISHSASPDRPGAFTVKQLRSQIHVDPENSEAHWQLAAAFINAQQQSKALPHLDWLIRRQPSQSRAYVQRGLIHFDRGEWKAAVRDLQTGVDNGERSAAVLSQLAASFLNLHQYADAEQTASLSIESDDEYVNAYFVRCLARSSQRNVSGAHSDLKIAKDLGLIDKLVANCETAIATDSHFEVRSNAGN